MSPPTNPPKMHFRCPGCNKKFRTNRHPHPNESVACPKCGMRIALDKLISGPLPPITPPPPADTPALPPIPVPSGGMPAVPEFTILRELGKGGMGVVYLARSQRLNRVVALKMIRPSAGDPPQDLARFYSEAEAMARLRHPGVLQIHQVGEYEGKPFLVLEYVDGGNLQQRLTGQPQPIRAAAGLVEQLARIVAFMHRRQVLHRDLKPGNILLASTLTAADAEEELVEALEYYGTPKISDFGLARQLDREAGLTRGGMVLGTLAYMAPEQARGRRELVGPAADVYSLGAIFYELLTGRPPFQAEEPGELYEMILHEAPVPPRRLNPQVPRDLEPVCLRCLEKDLHRRYRSAADLAADLRCFLRGEPIPSGSAGSTGRTSARRGRSLWMNALVAAVTACVVSAAWWWKAEIKSRDASFNDKYREAEIVFRQAMLAWRAYGDVVSASLLTKNNNGEYDLSNILTNGGIEVPEERKPGERRPPVPFPARFVEKLNATDTQTWRKIFVYSNNPFPGRTHDLDAWQRETLEQLEAKAQAEENPVRVSEGDYEGQKEFRYARVIRMWNQTCCDCHNAEKWKFGKKWKPKEFRGVLEVRLHD